MQFSKQIVLAAFAIIAPAAMHADTMTISSNPTMSVGNLTFDNFSCSGREAGALVTPSSCGQINVGTITQPGTGIQISSGFFAAKGFVDTVIEYHVSSSTGISNVGLAFDGSFAGDAIASVTESVFAADHRVGFAKVVCGSASFGVGCNQTSDIALSGTFSDLYIEKDIYLGAESMSNASTSIIDQTFSSSAPEPSSVALMGSGLLAAAALIRRKNKSI